MPSEELGRRARAVGVRHSYRLAVQGVIRVPVLVVITQPLAHFEPAFCRDGYIAAIEESVQVSPQEQAVPDIVWALAGIRADVRGLQYRK